MRVCSWLVAVACLLTASMAAAAPGDLVYARPGRLVSVGDHRLNLYCMGRGSPAVVYDPGFGDWAPAFAYVQPQVAKFTRICTYDPAGTGFSDPGPMPRTSPRLARELHTALRAARVRGAYILVGHAFGSYNARAFADLFLRDTAGLVLLEGDAGDVEPPALRADNDHGRAGGIADLRKCHDALAAGAALPSDCAQSFFRGLPDDAWSRELNAALLRLAASKPAMYETLAPEMSEMWNDETWLQTDRRSLGDRPVRVISTRRHGLGRYDPAQTFTPKQQAYQAAEAEAQARWISLSTNARQIFADRSAEYMVFDQPDLVVATIREVYEQSKTRGSATSRRQGDRPAPVIRKPRR